MKEKVLVPYPHYYLTKEDVDKMFKEMVRVMFLGIICNIKVGELNKKINDEEFRL